MGQVNANQRICPDRRDVKASESRGASPQTVLDPRTSGITGDPDRLQQVVWDLLINAGVASPRRCCPPR